MRPGASPQPDMLIQLREGERIQHSYTDLVRCLRCLLWLLGLIETYAGARTLTTSLFEEMRTIYPLPRVV